MLKIAGKGLYAPFGSWQEFKEIVAGNGPLFGTSRLTSPKEQGLTRFVSTKFLRRLDHFTKMVLLAGHLALEDMQKNLYTDPGRLGIIICTGYGPCQTTFDFLDSMLSNGPHLGSPLAFSHSVHNVPAGILAMSLQKQCPCLTICQPCLTVSSGIIQAWTWLKGNTVDTVLFGAVDEDTELLRYCTQRMHARLRPEQTLIQEGAFFMCLRKADNDQGFAGLGFPLDSAEGVPGAEVAVQSRKCETNAYRLAGMHSSFPIAAAFCLAAFLSSAITDIKQGFVRESSPNGSELLIPVKCKVAYV